MNVVIISPLFVGEKIYVQRNICLKGMENITVSSITGYVDQIVSLWMATEQMLTGGKKIHGEFMNPRIAYERID